MSHSFFIEKILEKNISDTLLEHEFRSSAFSSGAERFPIHTAEYLRLSEIEESRYSAILEELNSDNTVKISETLTEKEGFFSFVLSRHNGAFNQTADTVYKLILLRYPTLSSSLRIREYAVFFVGGECPEKNAAALKRFLLFSGEYREITEGEMTEEVTIPKPSGSPKKQHSISANENPELSEPFMTTQSEKALNKYIRTCDELQKCVSLPTRAGATTPYSATSYSLLENQLRELDITMDKEDAVNAQHYFLAESREPTNMELRIIDRYRSERWSHSALNTAIDVSSINDGNVQAAYNDFTEVCGELGSDPKTATLADIVRAPFDLWAQTEEHTLTDFENIKQHSLVRIDERRIGIGLDTGDKKSLLAFAHESNNSRTSVDPAGGASACLGESTRKLLRIFATPYDAIRISGIAHPESCDGSDATEDAELRPDQRSLARLACDSFASYARATALPCSANFEYVSDDFVSKHLEVSAVLASIDPETVKHNLESERTIVPGDMIMLIGSRTGREGRVYNRYLKTITDPLILELQRQVGENGKAAEASEATEEADSQETVISEPQINAESVDIGNLGHSHSGIQRAEIVYRENLAAQHGITLYGEAVPGGDPSMQRKLMRICADSNFRKRVKKIRDVDSSGIVTAVSTLAKGVSIYLDCIPLKYNGLVATEAAFSETCERMVLVVSESDAANVTEICNREGVICAGIGTVTGDGHLSVYASGEKIAYLSTDFLLNSKPERRSEVQVELPADLPDSEALEIALRPMEESKRKYWFFSKRQPDHIGAYEHLAISAGLRACVRKRRFDNTLNGTSLFSPMSDGLSSAAISYICDGSGILTKPVKDGERVRNEKLCSAISLGMLPDISAADPYKGSYYAVTEALGRLVAAGFSQENSHIAIHVSHPYYKSNLIQNGHTFSAMLGLYDAQQKLETLSLCGDYSLGGLNDGATKPSVAVFGIGADIESRFHSSEFKEEGNKLVLFKPEMGKNGLPIPSLQLELFNKVERLFAEGIAVSAISLTGTSLAEGVMQMCFGTACRLGFDFDPDCKPEELYDTLYGAIAVELPHGADIPRGGISFGTVNSKGTVVIKSKGAKTDSEQGDVIIPISRLYELYRKKEAEIYERVSAENVDETTDARLVQQFNYSGNDLLRTPEQVKADRQIANQTEKYLNALHGNGEGEAPKPTKRRVATSQIMLFAPENRVNVVVPIFNGTIGDGLPIRYLTEKANPDRISVCPVRCGMDKQSIERLSEMIQNAGMLYLPDGTDSPLVIGAILKNEKIARAIQTLRKNCGLIYGSGSGFSALISAGLLGKDVPSGDYRDLENTEFTHPVNGEVISGGYISLSANPLSGLTRQSVLLRACSLRSPFMRFAEQGEIYRSELSSYKGRLIGESQLLTRAGAEGMIPTQFCDLNGEPSMHTEYNPCQAMMSIDSFTSFDGTVFGQISAPERALICKEPELKEFKALPVLESALAYLSE